MTAQVTSISRTRAAAVKAETQARLSIRLVALLLGSVAVLAVVGLGTLWSASSVVSLREFGVSTYYLSRQIAWLGAGGLLAGLGAVVPYRLYRRLAVPIHLVSLAGLVAVLAIGHRVGGATSWLRVGGISLQPSEFSKLALVVFLAAVLESRQHLLVWFSRYFWLVVGSLGVTTALILLQPDLGTVLVLGGSALVVLIASQAPLLYSLATAFGGGLFGLGFAWSAEYRWQRITSFLDPFADRFDTGLQAVQGLLALGTGGWFGVGLGASRARWEFLPNAHTDFLFAILGEEAGLIGGLCVLTLFVVFTLTAIAISMRAPDGFGRLLGLGITGWISIQALINIGGVVGLMPITGLPLPFMSVGGSALVAELAGVGILVNLAKAGRRR